MRVRFSIRDLLRLTLVVAMGLGWFVREVQLRESSAGYWRAAYIALENALNSDGWGVERKYALRVYPLSDSRLSRDTEHDFLIRFPSE